MHLIHLKKNCSHLWVMVKHQINVCCELPINHQVLVFFSPSNAIIVIKQMDFFFVQIHARPNERSTPPGAKVQLQSMCVCVLCPLCFIYASLLKRGAFWQTNPSRYINTKAIRAAESIHTHTNTDKKTRLWLGRASCCCYGSVVLMGCPTFT